MTNIYRFLFATVGLFSVGLAQANTSQIQVGVLKKSSNGRYAINERDGLPQILLTADRNSGEGVYLDLQNSSELPMQYRQVFFAPALGALNPTYDHPNVVWPPRDWEEIACSGVDQRGKMFEHNKEKLTAIVGSIRHLAGSNTNMELSLSQVNEFPTVRVVFPQRRDLGAITFYDYNFYKNNLEPAVNIDLKGQTCPGGY